jgi:pimeloyl-ACP methyl ester carboxylesterase
VEAAGAAGASAKPPSRPQTPKGPFAYDRIDILTKNMESGYLMAGTLTVPVGVGPHPAVVLITGSGAQDRNETLFAHRPFAVIADHLTTHGVAVLRFDDRGVGGSGGVLDLADHDALTSDVLTAVSLLAKRDGIDPEHIGVLGHSEGGITGPLAATRSPDISFVVNMAGPGVDGRSVLMLQARYLYTSGGFDEAVVDELLVLHAAALDADASSRPDAVRRLVAAQLAAGGAALDQATTAKVTRDAIKSFGSPWFRSFIALDPTIALRDVRVPTLALFGSLDVQVPPDPHESAVRAALADNEDASVVVFDGLNHLFQEAETGAIEEYGQIEQTISPVVLDHVTAWIRTTTGLDPSP